MTLLFYLQIQQLLNNLENDSEPVVKQDANSSFLEASKSLHKIREDGDLDEIEKRFCQVIEDQLKNFEKKSPRYNLATFELSYLINSKSPAAYRTLREKKILKLPHPHHLRKVARCFNLRADKKEENLEYLKEICRNLEPHERIINLQGDEIYLKEGVTMKNGRLNGFARNHPTKTAKTCFTIFLNSIFSNIGEVFNVIPVVNLTAKDIITYMDDAILTLQEIGFVVVAVSVDGHRTNQKFIREKGEGKNWFPNPDIEDAKIFLFFDSLHIFKNLRNNWISGEFAQNKVEPILTFPAFEENTKLKADFNDIRQIFLHDLHTFQDDNEVIHNAYGLTSKALWITSFDRQKEGLVRQIFNERICAELFRLEKSGTGNYVEIVCRWEHLMNSKSPISGKTSRIADMEPYKSAQDPKLEELRKFISWIDRWKSSEFQGTKKLSNDTFDAFRHTTSAMIEFVEYIFKTFDAQ